MLRSLEKAKGSYDQPEPDVETFGPARVKDLKTSLRKPEVVAVAHFKLQGLAGRKVISCRGAFSEQIIIYLYIYR